MLLWQIVGQSHCLRCGSFLYTIALSILFAVASSSGIPSKADAEKQYSDYFAALQTYRDAFESQWDKRKDPATPFSVTGFNTERDTFLSKTTDFSHWTQSESLLAVDAVKKAHLADHGLLEQHLTKLSTLVQSAATHTDIERTHRSVLDSFDAIQKNADKAWRALFKVAGLTPSSPPLTPAMITIIVLISLMALLAIFVGIYLYKYRQLSFQGFRRK